MSLINYDISIGNESEGKRQPKLPSGILKH